MEGRGGGGNECLVDVENRQEEGGGKPPYIEKKSLASVGEKKSADSPFNGQLISFAKDTSSHLPKSHASGGRWHPLFRAP